MPTARMYVGTTLRLSYTFAEPLLCTTVENCSLYQMRATGPGRTKQGSTETDYPKELAAKGQAAKGQAAKATDDTNGDCGDAANITEDSGKAATGDNNAKDCNDDNNNDSNSSSGEDNSSATSSNNRPSQALP